MVPYLASAQVVNIKPCERITILIPSIGHQSFLKKNPIAVTMKSRAAKSQSIPIGLEISLVNCAISPNWKAFAIPIKWIRPCRIINNTKTMRICYLFKIINNLIRL